ncbi:hypothetical protein [Schlesneria sp. T3-172]|uniref:hypothetical protein n=1 Tax=Schlesneria sphaerica TaxID=3373610 RepID=UPI0037CA1554
MDINGFQVVSEPSDKTEEGFSSTVHRGGQVRGPFQTVKEAIACAQKWATEPRAKVAEPGTDQAAAKASKKPPTAESAP